MPAQLIDRDGLAAWHAREHLQTDPGITVIYHLPGGASEREIRLVEVNELIAERDRDPLEPLDFGVDIGDPTAHKLLVIDVTPAQWKAIENGDLSLPPGWSLAEAIPFRRP